MPDTILLALALLVMVPIWYLVLTRVRPKPGHCECGGPLENGHCPACADLQQW